MPVITYTAERRLASGHSASTQYQIELDFQQIDPADKKTGFEQESLDLSSSAYLYAITGEWIFTTDWLAWSTDLDDWQEFLASVANRETFAIDFTGTIASPGTDVNMILLPGWSYRRQGGLYFAVNFRTREV